MFKCFAGDSNVYTVVFNRHGCLRMKVIELDLLLLK